MPVEKEVIVVGDGSADGTTSLLREETKKQTLKILFHERNLGKGSTIRTTLDFAEGDIICIQDADLEYDLFEILALLKGFKDSSDNAAFGSRFLKKNPWFIGFF